MNEREYMRKLAEKIDETLNGEKKAEDREIGFVLLTFRFGEMEGGRINYISNGQREDVHIALKELLARWEGQALQTGRA